MTKPKWVLPVAFLLLCAGAPAWTDPDPSASQKIRLATANLERGREQMATATTLKTNARRIDTLDRALYFLRRARAVTLPSTDSAVIEVRKDVESNLVQALDSQAQIYYSRSSYSLAKKRLEESLAIDPQDSQAQRLSEMIKDAESEDIYDKIQGRAAIDRIRERRAAAGMPLRDRGIANRR